jgi:uncharacterized membrane protein YidH (DUF202 family)
VRTAIAIMAFGFLVQKFDLFLRIATGSIVRDPRRRAVRLSATLPDCC